MGKYNRNEWIIWNIRFSNQVVLRHGKLNKEKLADFLGNEKWYDTK